MNGSLNDFSMQVLPFQIFTSPLKGLEAYVNDSLNGSVVNFCLRNAENTFVHISDFPLTEDEILLNLDNQIRTTLPYLEERYMCNLGIKFYKIPNWRYILKEIRLNLPHNKEVCSGTILVGKERREDINPLLYWRNIIKNTKTPINYPSLYQKLLEFKQNLKIAFNREHHSEEGYLPLFINISNAMCMIYENYGRKKEMREYHVYFESSGHTQKVKLEDITEHIFLDYSKTALLIRNKTQNQIEIPFESYVEL